MRYRRQVRLCGIVESSPDQTGGLALPYLSVSYYRGLRFFHIWPRVHGLRKRTRFLGLRHSSRSGRSPSIQEILIAVSSDRIVLIQERRQDSVHPMVVPEKN